MYKRPERRTVTIASGQTTTEKFYVQDYVLAGIFTPAALTGTALTFLAGTVEDDTFVAVYDSDGNQVSLAAAADRAIGLSGSEADALAPWPWLQIVSGSAEAAARTLVVSLK